MSITVRLLVMSLLQVMAVFVHYLVMVNGWGLQPVGWAWILFGWFFSLVSVWITSIMLVIIDSAEKELKRGNG